MAKDLRKRTLPIYRIAVLGARGVGKTSLINTFVNNSFTKIYEETENDIRRFRRVYDINKKATDPQYVMFQIDDIFPIDHQDIDNESDSVKSLIFYGLLENKQIRNDKKNNANIMQVDKQVYGYIFVYSVDDSNSFEKVCDVIKYLHDYCEKTSQYSGITSKKMLVGNKQDLNPTKLYDRVTLQQIEKLKQSCPMQNYFVSAKTSFNVTTIFEEMGKMIVQDIKVEVKEKDWWEEKKGQIETIDQQKMTNQNKALPGGIRQGFFTCSGRGGDAFDSDDEEMGYEQKDDELENVPEWKQGMEATQETCEMQ